jgi:sulfur-carrier protein
MTTVRIPPTLRPDAEGQREVSAAGSTVGEVLQDVGQRFPDLRARIFENGNIARFVNVYVGGEDIRTQDGLETPVADGATVILLPAMAGGVDR